jgi:hypothetical protein
MTSDPLHTLLRGSEGKTFHFVFFDGTEMVAEVVSSTHVDEDDTIVLMEVPTASASCGWQVRLADIRSASAPPG